MEKNKAHVAAPYQYPKVAPKNYYATAFKKSAAEKKEGKRLKKEWEDGKAIEYGGKIPTKPIKKINNPSLKFCNLTS